MRKIKGLTGVFSLVLILFLSTCSGVINPDNNSQDQDLIDYKAIIISQLTVDASFDAGRIILQVDENSTMGSTRNGGSSLNESDVMNMVNNIATGYSVDSVSASKIVITDSNRTVTSRAIDDEIITAANNRYILQYDNVTKSDTIEIVKQLNADITVTFAEPDYIVGASFIPNDPGYSNQWGLPIIGAPAAWDDSSGDSVVIVAVIDTGVDYTHQDLSANMVSGYDFCNNDSDPYDDNGHGTHVAGIIGALGNNSIGVSGVAPHVRIMPLKFLSGSGSGYSSNAVKCIDYAILHGADVTNNSWGGGSYSATLRSAILRSRSANVLFVAAAGNSGTDNDSYPHYPSSYDCANIIAVASTDSNDQLSSFSCYGYRSVDIAAPGSSIYSTYPGNSYRTLSGTSMAAPFVSGAIALYLSVSPTIGYAELKAKLMNDSTKLSSLNGKIASGGRLFLNLTMPNEQDVYIQNVSISSSAFYSAQNNIFTGPNVLMTNTSNVKITAGNKIILQSGTKINSGAKFHAYIQ